jgi:hypothetical protein
MSAALGAFPPAPQARTLTLPNGASLTGMVDLPRGVSDQCRVSMNLMLQLGPFLASIECLLHVLEFVQWCIDFVKKVPDVPTDPTGVIRQLEKLPPIAEHLEKCFGFVLPTAVCPFIKDVLTMVRDFIECVTEVLDSVLKQNLELQVKFGDAQGNPELLEVLQLAQSNLDATQAQAAQSMAPVLSLLSALGVFFDIMGVGQLALPSIDDLTGGELDPVLQVLKDLVEVLTAVIEALPC